MDEGRWGRGRQLVPCGPLSIKAAKHHPLHRILGILRGSSGVQVLAWLQPCLTDQFIKLAFHPETFRTDPALIERERAWSNQNPPYMFRCAAHRCLHVQAGLCLIWCLVRGT